MKTAFKINYTRVTKGSGKAETLTAMPVWAATQGEAVAAFRAQAAKNTHIVLQSVVAAPVPAASILNAKALKACAASLKATAQASAHAKANDVATKVDAITALANEIDALLA